MAALPHPIAEWDRDAARRVWRFNLPLDVRSSRP